MPDGVGHHLGDGEIAGRFQRGVEPFGQIDLGLTRQGQVQGQRPNRLPQAPVGEHRRVHPPDQAAQFLQRRRRGDAGLHDQRGSFVRTAVDHLLGDPEVHPDGDKPSLRAVMQISLDPAQLRRRGVDRLGPRLGQLPHPPGQRRIRLPPQQPPGVRQHGQWQQPDPQGQQHRPLDPAEDRRMVSHLDGEGRRRSAGEPTLCTTTKYRPNPL